MAVLAVVVAVVTAIVVAVVVLVVVATEVLGVGGWGETEGGSRADGGVPAFFSGTRVFWQCALCRLAVCWGEASVL